MQNKKIIILIILGAMAVISLFYGMFAPPNARRNSVSGQPGIPRELTAIIENPIARLTRNAKKTAYPSWSNDPFLKSSAPAEGYQGPVLNGIMWDEEKPMAIINGNIVKIGSKAGANTVVDIKQDKVILNDGAKDFELNLN